MNFKRDALWIDGRWATPSSDSVITVTNPATLQTLGLVPEAAESDVDAAVAAARRAFTQSEWANSTPAFRADAMERLAAALESRATETATAATAQIGMPTAIATVSEAITPALLLRYYARLAREMQIEQVRDSFGGGRTLVRNEPIGVVAAVVPWNFPQTLTFFKVAPLLAAGCTVVIKPAPETVLDAFILADAVEEAGLPSGVINIVPGGREVGAYLIGHPGIDKVSFTGSVSAGRAIGEVCGRLLRPSTLELGGKSAAIILDDADLGVHLQDFFAATLMNSGQTCYLGTRVLAPRSRYAEIVGTISDFVSSLPLGDPTDPATVLGPVVSERQRDRVESYIAKGLSEGARLTTGGARREDLGPGYFIAPTVFADVDNSSTIASEEIFGPVLSVIPYVDVDDAVQIANNSEYGLGGSVWTEDAELGLDIARRVQTGSIGINNYMLDFASPFGGVKSSGIGRELGPEGIGIFQATKSIYLS
ncbi:aldehyde dehydrogenase [Nocardia sp. NPDC004123]